MLRLTLVLARFAALFVALFVAVVVTTGFAHDSPAAMQLYNKGVNLLEAGKGDAARQAFNTIVEKYPASAYSKLAHQELDKPLVGSVEFKELGKLSVKDVRKQFELANARLMVGRVWNMDADDQARTMLAQMMIKRKMVAKDITVTVVDLPNNKKAVTLTVVR
jgi:TolA-binding protein